MPVRLLSVAALLLAWGLASLVVPGDAVPSPARTAAMMWENLASGDVVGHVRPSATTVAHGPGWAYDQRGKENHHGNQISH